MGGNKWVHPVGKRSHGKGSESTCEAPQTTCGNLPNLQSTVGNTAGQVFHRERSCREMMHAVWKSLPRSRKDTTAPFETPTLICWKAAVTHPQKAGKQGKPPFPHGEWMCKELVKCWDVPELQQGACLSFIRNALCISSTAAVEKPARPIGHGHLPPLWVKPEEIELHRV